MQLRKSVLESQLTTLTLPALTSQLCVRSSPDYIYRAILEAKYKKSPSCLKNTRVDRCAIRNMDKQAKCGKTWHKLASLDQHRSIEIPLPSCHHQILILHADASNTKIFHRDRDAKDAAYAEPPWLNGGSPWVFGVQNRRWSFHGSG